MRCIPEYLKPDVNTQKVPQWLKSEEQDCIFEWFCKISFFSHFFQGHFHTFFFPCPPAHTFYFPLVTAEFPELKFNLSEKHRELSERGGTEKHSLYRPEMNERQG